MGKNLVDTKSPKQEERQKLFGPESNKEIEAALQLVGKKRDMPEELANLITLTIKENQTNKPLKEGSLCDQPLLEKTSEKLQTTLQKSGYGDDLHIEPNVTVTPKGTAGNMVWKEAWTVLTPIGTILYPIVFVDNPQGDTITVGLTPEKIDNTSDTKSNVATNNQEIEPQNDSYYNSIKPLLSKDNGGRIKHTILYFSASWCGPCQQFTPFLENWYLKTKAKHPEMEIVWVSLDKTEKNHNKYGEKMPWSQVSFSQRNDADLKTHAARGIPFIVLINRNGQALTGKEHPNKTLPEIEEFITGQTTPANTLKTGVFN